MPTSTNGPIRVLTLVAAAVSTFLVITHRNDS